MFHVRLAGHYLLTSSPKKRLKKHTKVSPIVIVVLVGVSVLIGLAVVASSASEKDKYDTIGTTFVILSGSFQVKMSHKNEKKFQNLAKFAKNILVHKIQG